MLVPTHPSAAVGSPANAPSPVTTNALAPRAPLEQSGRRRDDARLLVGWRSNERLVEARMADLESFLDPGDVVVVNASATIPAALVLDDDVVVHLSTRLAQDTDSIGTWVVEVRRRCGHGSTAWLGYRPNGPLLLPGEGRLHIVEPYPPANPPGVGPGRPVRLWTARLHLPSAVHDHLARFGRPIRYGCDAHAWPITAYQTIFATEPGSAEMPSAGRGFTTELVTRLVSHGVAVTPITLHTGVSSQDADELPYPERYAVPRATVDAIHSAHAAGRRVIAVGTTATRALETVAGCDGRLRPGHGWTDLVITPERGVRAVDGLLTGWHDPEASHLQLVETVAGRELLDVSYARAIDAGFHGHEFGDFHLVLP